MKRASLTTVPKAQKTAAPDLTDRLLERAPAQKPAKPAAARPQARPPAPKSAKTAKPRRPRVPKSGSISLSDKSVPSVEKEPDPLEHALVQSQAALAALQSAALAEPGRYDLALRYRLDALAHHLTQVTQFVETSVRKQRGG